MERDSQKRIIRKIELEKFLSHIPSNPHPQTNLEQYTTTEAVAATILYLIAFSNEDINGKSVLDLGCGTGRLALGAAYLGAKTVVGIDLDPIAVKTAYTSAKQFNLVKIINWIIGDVSLITGCFDTVIQNPPFGIQKRHADRKFLKKALEVGKTVYSIHAHPSFDKKLIKRFRKKSSTLIRTTPSPFLKKYVEAHNGNIRAVYSMLMTIPRMFDFHKKQYYSFVIDLYWIKRFE